MDFRSALDFHHKTMLSIVRFSNTRKVLFYASVMAICLVLFSGVVRSENISHAKKAITKILNQVA